MKDSDVAWFRPLWRRVAITVFLAIWCAWEWFWNKDQFWSLLTLAALAYALWNFFISFDRGGPPGGDRPS